MANSYTKARDAWRAEKGLPPISSPSPKDTSAPGGGGTSLPETALPPTPAPKPKTPTPKTETAEGLTSKERGFTPDPGWTVVEKNAQGKPTVYEDKQGVRHYSPESTMWGMGFQTGGKRVEGQGMVYESGPVVQGQYRGGGTGEQPYVPVATPKGVKHITQLEAERLSQLTDRAKHEELQNMGIIAKDVKYVSPEQQQKTQQSYKQAVRYLRDNKLIDNAGNVDLDAFASRNERTKQALYDIGLSGVTVSNIAKDIKALSDFKNSVTGDYNLAEAVNAGVATSIIKRYFGESSYQEAIKDAKLLKEYQAYQNASPKGKFDMLITQGQIPKGSKFDSIDNDGNVVYYPPEQYQELNMVYDTALAKFKTLSPLDQRTIIGVARGYADMETMLQAITVNDPKAGQKLTVRLNTIEAVMAKGKKVNNQSARYAKEQLEIDIASIYNVLPSKIGATNATIFDKLTPKEQELVISYYSNIEPTKILGIKVDNPAKVVNLKEGLKAGKALAVLIPGVGTAVYWNNEPMEVAGVKVPKNVERATNVLLDTLIIATWIKPGIIARALGSLKGAPKKLPTIEKMLQQGTKAAEKTLATVDGRLVQPYRDMVKAQTTYATNLVKARNLELAIAKYGKYGPGGKINRASSLAKLNTQAPVLEARLKQAAEGFVEAQSKAAKAAYNDIPLIQSSFPTDIIKDTKSTVNMVFQDIKGVKTTEKQIAKLVKQLDRTEATATMAARIIQDLEIQQITAKGRRAKVIANTLNKQKQILQTAQRVGGRVSMEIAQRQAEYLIAKSGQARVLHKQLVNIRGAIENTRAKMLSLAKRRDKEALEIVKKKLAKLLEKEQQLHSKMVVSIKATDIEWAKPLTRGDGNILVNTRPPRFIPGQAKGKNTLICSTSSGAKTTTNTPLLMAMAGQKVKMWAINDDGELVIYEPRNPWIKDPDTEIFIFEPGKTPYPGGLVTTAPTKPGVKPSPIHPPIPEPEPYTTVWIMEAPKIKEHGILTIYNPQRKTVSKSGGKTTTTTATTTDTKKEPQAESKKEPQAESKIGADTALKTSPKSIVEAATNIKSATTPATLIAPKTMRVSTPAIPTTTKYTSPKESTKKVLPKIAVESAENNKRRKKVKESASAIAYQRGELRGKDVWHVWYKSKDGKVERTIILGDAPKGATVYDGPGSAKRSIQRLYGPGLSKDIVEDTGAVDTIISPGGEKPLISFRRDTTISKKPPRITPKPPRIS